MNPADRTDAILHGDGDAAPVINTDGVARADHAEITEDGRVFLTASGQGKYSTPPEVVNPAQGTGAFLPDAAPLLPSYDELQQCCGELEGELENMHNGFIAVAAQRDRAWAACRGADAYLNGRGENGSVGMEVAKSLLNAVAIEAAQVNP